MKDLDSVYFTARELAPEDRPAYLEEACKGELALRTRVEQMLSVTEQAEALIPDPVDIPRKHRIAGRPPDECETNTADVVDKMTGRMIGRYRILERIGEGGCGVVYVAEQIEPVRRRVALKVIKLGMDTERVVTRFEAERQALAMMDHPNIAKVHDGGTTDVGRPFFVMELVHGIRITQYCQQHNLGTRKRLDLFIKVCQAIQHAHQKGVIHRDIKPSNILVTLHDGEAVPKVIDFGIAKATEGHLADATVYTQVHQFMGTPAYMSPEQAEISGLDVDTRSDIYSLGVLLYELLSGSTPFDTRELLASGIDAMRKAIRETEPMRPSTRLRQTLVVAGAPRRTWGCPGDSDDSRRGHQELMGQLKGDLDWIVMKCLEKDRTRRYETANALAMDIGRHLNMEPVVARPPSRLYEFQKTVCRHKFGFAVTTALLIVLTAGVLTSTWQAVKATRVGNALVQERAALRAAEKRAMTLQEQAGKQMARAEWLVYAGKLMLAQADFDDGNGGLFRRYLDECPENLRGWEHRYLSTRISAKQTLVGHTRVVTSAAFSPDGKRVVTGCEDGTARVWDAATGEELIPSMRHAAPVTSVGFGPDGNRIVTGAGRSGDPNQPPGVATVWDATTGEKLRELTGHTDRVWSVAFSRDGRRIITGSGDGTAVVWDAGTGEVIRKLSGHGGGVLGVAFSQDDKLIATASSDNTAIVWNADTFGAVWRLEGHGSDVHSLAFSQDGTRIVTGSADRTAKVWDVGTGKEAFASLRHAGEVHCVAFSLDGGRIVTGGDDQTARVWDAATGQDVLVLKGCGGKVRSVAFSPDGQCIVTGGSGKTTKIWDAERGQELPKLVGHGDFVSSIAFSPDGKRIVTGSGDRKAIVWGSVDCKPIRTLEGHTNRIWSVAFSPDGKRIVTGSEDRSARVWDAATGKEIRQLRLRHTHTVTSVAFSPDGKRIVTGVGERGGGGSGEATLWDAVSGYKLRSLDLPAAVWSAVFSPDGKLIVIGCGDQTARVCDAASLQEFRQLSGHTGWVTSAAFSRDGKRLLTGSGDQTTIIWDAETWLKQVSLKGHTGIVRSVAFSPDGDRIVTGGDDCAARVWDAGTGQELLSLKGNRNSVWSVAFSPDGNRIVTGIAGADASAKVWYAAP